MITATIVHDKGIKVYDIILTGADSIEYSDKYLEDVKDLLVELEEYTMDDFN